MEQRQLVNGGAKVFRRARPLDVLVLGLMPSPVFALILCLFTFSYQDFPALVWAMVVVGFGLGLIFLVMGAALKRNAHLALGFLVLSAVIVAVPVGLYIGSAYMAEYWELEDGATYRNISPGDPGASRGDASVVQFVDGTYLNIERSLGYMAAGTVYCVAPVSMRDQAMHPQYWAAGEDCCGKRGSFACDDAADAAARSGVVVTEELENYRTAVRMAVAYYGMDSPNGNATFVRWKTNARDYKDSLWSGAIVLMVGSIVIHFVATMCSALFLGRFLPM